MNRSALFAMIEDDANYPAVRLILIDVYMNQKKINQSIEALIMNAPKNYVFNQNDLHLMRRYDKCEDSELNEQFVFGRVWKMLQKDDDYNELTKEFEGKVLVTHGGSGKAITRAPMGASFHVFNDDYFCHVITRALTSGRKTKTSCDTTSALSLSFSI